MSDVMLNNGEVHGNSSMLAPQASSPVQPLPGLLGLESLAPDASILLDIKGLGGLVGARDEIRSGG